MGLPELWGSPRSRRKCSEIRVSRGSARTVGRRTGGCCLGRSGKSKPAWNQGSHGPANQEPGRASAEEKSPALRHGDLLIHLSNTVCNNPPHLKIHVFGHSYWPVHGIGWNKIDGLVLLMQPFDCKLAIEDSNN